MLKRPALSPFTQGEIKPGGWLKRQLHIQAEGLSGHLDQVWPDIRDSKWIGGDRDGWERVPYWLDGFIPLAYLLEDEQLIARAKRYIDGILLRQEEDGWICPCTAQERKFYDMWAYILILKVLVMYADLSGDERIEGAVDRALQCMEKHLRHQTLFNWASTRWYECLIPIFWLYERKGEAWLLDFALRLRAQGFDYSQSFQPYLDQEPKRQWTYGTHVVNLAMMLKQEGLVSRLLDTDPNEFALKAHDVLKEHHGMACGHFTGDECVAGTSPVQGSELCGVVEAMYSFETLLSISANPHWADEVERLAFNALPAGISPDMWSHQYDQQTNQIRCAPLPQDHVVFGTNSGESHLFGLEPNFGCCTANFNQGWPKLAMSSFMRSDRGLASCLMIPSTLRFEHAGAAITCSLATDYPFRDSATYTITCDRPTQFALDIRIPAFADSALVDGQPATPGSFYTIERVWQGTQTVQLSMTFSPRLVQRPGDMLCLWRGPLLYSLAIDERWEKREYERDGVERKHPWCDYEVHPTSAWNYGFTNQSFTVNEAPLSDQPFSPNQPPISITAQLTPIDWPEEHGICLAAPRSRAPLGKAHTVRMIPYGCTNLRMTEMPMVDTE